MSTGIDPEGTRASERWAEQAVRLYRRYEREIVEACDLCPWAVRVRHDGRIRERVLLQEDDTLLAPSLDAIFAFAKEDIDVALLLYPKIGLGRAAFDHFASRLRDADVARQSLGQVPFVFAVFHPEAAPDTREAERLIPFLRRTPDPTIQLLRSSVVDRVRGTTPQGTQFVDAHLIEALSAPVPSLRERIATANLATTLRLGVDTLTHHFDEIIRDREETYRALRQ
jgi:hypothetical protein